MNDSTNYPVLLEIPVQWGEMDAAGHVNNLIHLRWFESARVEYFVRLGYDVVDPQGDTPGFILARQECKYLFPVVFPDTITAGVRVTEIGEDRFTMECRMWSKRHARLVAIASGVMVTYDYQHRRKTPVPEAMRRKVETLEQGQVISDK